MNTQDPILALDAGTAFSHPPLPAAPSSLAQPASCGCSSGAQCNRCCHSRRIASSGRSPIMPHVESKMSPSYRPTHLRKVKHSASYSKL